MEFWLLVGIGTILYIVYKSLKSTSNNRDSKIPNSVESSNSHIQVTLTTPKRTMVADEGQDDGLATFSISYGYDDEKSKNKAPGKWINPERSISIKGLKISNGNFYFGGQLPSLLEGHGVEASLVDESLRIIKQPYSYTDETLGYWPKYFSISPKCRGAYLSWLASSRNDPSTPLGYVFIFFYGLERRAVVDSIRDSLDDIEFNAIFEEVHRLKGIYNQSRSFRNYATRLLEIMKLLRPSVVSLPELEKNPSRDSILLKHRLSTIVDRGELVPADLALAWLKFHPDYNLRKPARRCSYEFELMFCRVYEQKYNEGFIVKPNKTRLKIEYWPASSSLRGVEIPQEDLPDPSNLKGPLNKLISIAEECTKALDAYSRYLGKKDTLRTDVSAILLLPEELSDLGDTLGINRFRNWAEKTISTKDGLVDVKKLWRFTKSPLPAKINKKESELIQALAEKAGFGVAPDMRYHHAKPSANGKIVIFSEGHGKHFEPSSAFNEIGMALRLGSMVANIDNNLDQSEIVLLKQLIDHDTNLSLVEKRSLHAYLVWRLNTASNVAGLRARLDRMGKSEKAVVSRILVGVAMADGRIEPEEVKQLEKLYKLLGLDKSLVTGDIHNFTTAKTDFQNTFQSSAAANSYKKSSTDFSLDDNVLAFLESETKDVQSMLSDIFVDDEPIEEAGTEEEIQSDKEDLGIDALHYSLYESLISKDRWQHEEIDDLTRSLGLMTSGAIDTINEWSFERVDAPVLEEEPDALYVDQEIVQELEG